MSQSSKSFRWIPSIYQRTAAVQIDGTSGEKEWQLQFSETAVLWRKS